MSVEETDIDRQTAVGGPLERGEVQLRDRVREADGRNPEPNAGLIDSQSVRTADTVPSATRGFDAGKKVKGRKQFIVTGTRGLLLAVHVVAANIQDRDGARRPLPWTRLDRPGVKKIWADQGSAGRLVDWTARLYAPQPDKLFDSAERFEVVGRAVKGRTTAWGASGVCSADAVGSVGIRPPRSPSSSATG
ncbi:transposase [Streptomyces sp. NPDC005820]|uniref:transposase n=1 Tax=Streptomyces sp. NPDC005820 TaxID=3157069 RepID=UPI0033DBFE97